MLLSGEMKKTKILIKSGPSTRAFIFNFVGIVVVIHSLHGEQPKVAQKSFRQFNLDGPL